MKQCSQGIEGLRSCISPSAGPFTIDSSSLALTASKSEYEDCIWGDYSLGLSFLSSVDHRSCLDDDDSLSRDVETTKEGQLLEDKRVLLNPILLASNLAERLIESSIAGDDLSCANTTVMSEKSSTGSVQDDSEEDSPCWIGINSRKTLLSEAKSRRSTDDLSGFRRLNPLAPQFVPFNANKVLGKDGKNCEKNSSSSLKKSLSSNFPSSSGEFILTDPLEDGRKSILTHNSDENLGFISQDTVSKLFQQSKRLDPLAPVFVPSGAKPSPVHEKQGTFDTNAHLTSALAYSDNKALGEVKVDASSVEAGRIHKSGSTALYNPWFESKVGVPESAKLGRSSNKYPDQRRLNPLAPQFSLANTKPKAYSYEKYQAADDISLAVNATGLSRYTEHYAVDADLAKSSEYVERFLPNNSHGSSSLISPTGDSNFGSTKWFSMEPNTALSINGNQDFQHPLPFHVMETAESSSSRNVKALSGTSPKMDVKKLLTTIHGLSELLTLAHGSESSDSPDADEVDLVNSTVQNLDLYIKNIIQEQAGNQRIVRHDSYDLKLLPNKSKLSIRDLELQNAKNMTVDLNVKRKEKYSVVSGETVPNSRLYQYGVTKDNGFGQVVAKSGYQQNHQGEEKINQHALFYKSLLLKAEADRCLMVYETSLSNPTS